MITIKQLKEYAKTKNYNLGQAEKDYIQEIILFILYREFGKELVFKGDTALAKCYGFNRFSEDLDFTAKEEKNFKKIISKGLKKFLIDFEVQEEKQDNSVNLIYWLQGPLYTGQKITACRIIIDISTREEVKKDVNIRTIGMHIAEVPFFDVVVMSEEEILSEKIRALVTRKKARDLYDLYYMLKKEVKINKNLINEKLKFYNKKFNEKEVKNAIKGIKIVWDKELKHLVKNYPPFEEVKKYVQELLLSG